MTTMSNNAKTMLPIEFIETILGIELYDYQKRMIDAYEQNQGSIVNACRNCGKTTTAVAYLIWWALANPEQSILISAPQNVHIEAIQQLVDKIGTSLRIHQSPNYRLFENGSFIEFVASSQIEKIRNRYFDVVYLDEFAFHDNSVEQFIPLVNPRKIIYSSTPSPAPHNSFSQLWEKAKTETEANIPTSLLPSLHPIPINWAVLGSGKLRLHTNIINEYNNQMT